MPEYMGPSQCVRYNTEFLFFSFCFVYGYYGDTASVIFQRTQGVWVLNTCYPDNGTTGWWVTWKVAPTRVGLGFAVRSDQRASEGIRECVCQSICHVSLVICFYIYILGLVFRINILALALVQYLTTARIPEVAPSLAHLC